MVRIDSTVTDALMHEPSDSSSSLGCGARDGAAVEGGRRLDRRAVVVWRDHRRAAKKRARAIEYTRGRPNRVQHYRELIKLTRATLAYARSGRDQLVASGRPDGRRAVASRVPSLSPADRADHRADRASRFSGRGGRRPTKRSSACSSRTPTSSSKAAARLQYGHKLNLTTGRSGLILDVVIEAGNPADSERFLPMLERHIAFYGEAPRQTAADGGFASRRQSQPGQGPRRPRRGVPQEGRPAHQDMVKSRWVYRKLRNFRAGIEADISCLKRAYGLARCIWRGLDHFKAYVWSSVVAYNLALFARLKPI